MCEDSNLCIVVSRERENKVMMAICGALGEVVSIKGRYHGGSRR